MGKLKLNKETLTRLDDKQASKAGGGQEMYISQDCPSGSFGSGVSGSNISVACLSGWPCNVTGYIASLVRGC